jgi:hypothetical protein
MRYNRFCMHAARASFLLFCCAGLMAQQPAALPPTAGSLSIQVVQGNGAINSIRLHRGHDVIVRLVDSDERPIGGVPVTFLLPATGASGTFGDRGLSLTVSTAADGTAAGRGLQPNAIAGPFQIRVVASWKGSPVAATLTETNVDPEPHPGRSKKIAIAVIIAGAAAGGAAAAIGHKSSTSTSGSTASTPPGSISSGTPTIGPPH